MTPQFVRKSLGLAASAASDSSPFTTVTTDSRKIQKGCLFVALKGEKFDGHDFIDNAVSQGARGVLVKKGTLVPAKQKIDVYEVSDTLEAYRTLAREWRKQFSIPVVVIAGSVGKTTTKEILAAMLRGKWTHILKTEGSQNGYIGVAITLLEMRRKHKAAVIEVGIDEPGAMEKHVPLIGAQSVVLTAIGPEHLEKLIDVPTVAMEEGRAFEIISRSNGTVIVNLDDPWIQKEAAKLSASTKKIGFTLGEGNPGPQKLVGKLDSTGRSLSVNGLSFKNSNFELPLLGEHNARNFLAALTLAATLGLNEMEISEGLKSFRGAYGRSEVHDLDGGVRVLCDYYNANPTSTEAGLKILSSLTPGGKKWACLADMLELGTDEEAFHRALATPLKQLKIDHVLLLGPRMKALKDELNRQQFPGSVHHFDAHAALATELLKNLKSGDAVLIKGSRGMKMEEIWNRITPGKGTLE